MIVNLFHGFCMALADSVPGVSGGTVAFILGFYERFINSLHSLFGKDATARKVAFLYLVKLGLGWAAGLAASMLVLANVVIENQNFEPLIHHYDRPDTLFYLDPPYFSTEDMYAVEFAWADHVRLGDAAANMQGRFLLSYNGCPL